MSSFAEVVAESFYSEVSMEWRPESVSHVEASFAVRSVLVRVDFEQRETNGFWHVGFNTVSREDQRTTVLLAFRIFNGVFQAVREFLETREPDGMIFAAKGEGVSIVLCKSVSCFLSFH